MAMVAPRSGPDPVLDKNSFMASTYHPVHRAQRVWRYGAAMLAVVAMLSGCTPTRSQPESSPTPTPGVPLHTPSTSATIETDVAAVQEAVAAYRGMWDAYMRVLAAPDPDSPDLARYAAGGALMTLVNGVRMAEDQGLKGEGTFTVSPRVTEITPTSGPTKIGISDCVDTSRSRIVRASPGPPYSDPPGGRRLCLATVEQQADGSWKVTSFGLHEVGTCT